METSLKQMKLLMILEISNGMKMTSSRWSTSWRNTQRSKHNVVKKWRGNLAETTSRSHEEVLDGRTRNYNILSENTGPYSYCLCKNYFWKQSKRCSQSIHLGRYSKRNCQLYQYKCSNKLYKNWKATDSEELADAFYEFFFLLEPITKTKLDRITDLWSGSVGPPIFNRAMARDRFCQFLSSIRFDNQDQRNRQDKFAPICLIFEQIVRKFEWHINQGQMWRHCPFTMYNHLNLVNPK